MCDFFLDDLRSVVAMRCGLLAFVTLIEKCIAHGANSEQIIGAIAAGYQLRERV